MMTPEEMRIYDFICDEEIATAKELNLARCLLDGSWEYVLNSVLYVRTGYHTIEQYIDEEWPDDEDWELVDDEEEEC